MDYLERLFPIISSSPNAVDKSWNLYDIFGFIEFCLLALCKSFLNFLWWIFVQILKFVFILLLTYGFAFAIFRFFRNVPLDNNEVRLKRPRDFLPASRSSIQRNLFEIDHIPQPLEDNIEFSSTPVPNRAIGMETDSEDEEIVNVDTIKVPSALDNTQISNRSIEKIIETTTPTKEMSNRSIEKTIETTTPTKEMSNRSIEKIVETTTPTKDLSVHEMTDSKMLAKNEKVASDISAQSRSNKTKEDL